MNPKQINDQNTRAKIIKSLKESRWVNLYHPGIFSMNSKVRTKAWAAKDKIDKLGSIKIKTSVCQKTLSRKWKKPTILAKLFNIYLIGDSDSDFKKNS